MAVHVFIIPGNPGIVGYYDDLAKRLKDNNVKVDVLRYNSFSDSLSEKLFSIEDEFADKREQILKLINPRDRNILVGHSIGGWISLRLMQEIDFESCILVFPFLKKDFSYKQLGINIALRYREPVVRLYDNIRKNWLGNVLLTKVVNSIDMSYAANKVTREWFLDGNAARKCLNLAKTEFDTLKYTFDFDIMEKVKDRLVFYYCNDDMWAPINDYNIISNLGCKTKLINCSHDFCVKKDEVKIITAEILKDINE